MELCCQVQAKPKYRADSPSMPPYPSTGLATSPDVLLRVMAHRADRGCSKILKIEYNLPRGEDSAEMFKSKIKFFKAALVPEAHRVEEGTSTPRRISTNPFDGVDSFEEGVKPPSRRQTSDEVRTSGSNPFSRLMNNIKTTRFP